MHNGLQKFKHKFSIRVRNFEVDSQGIVHNAIYLEYCEIGRFEYARNLGFSILPNGLLNGEVKTVVKRNEITYYSPARLDSLIDVYTRISYLKNSSFCFEHILIDAERDVLLVDQKSVQVNLNMLTNVPERIPENLREKVIAFEGENLILLK
jgi:acyl-CoA thioester hydrolase